jgi:hypothetical protein
MGKMFSALVLVIVALAPALTAQDNQAATTPSVTDLEALLGQVVRVETSGGGSFLGTLLTVGPDRLELVEPDGEIVQIAFKSVKRALTIPPGKGLRAFYQDSAANRLIVAPTGFPMDPGELHVTDQEAVVITGSYGLSRFVSLWGGISPAGALLSARAIASLNRLAFSAGSFIGLEWVGAMGGPVSGLLLPYALASWGEPDNNLSIGGALAFGFGSEQGFRSVGAVVEVGGKMVLTATTALVTENWLIWSVADGKWDPVPLAAIVGLVFRIAGSRFSWDIGALLPLQVRGGLAGYFDGAFIPVPWVSLTYRIR